ncbi:DUF58 domain-containing protein [Clostridium sp.]|uniref:DUF58 domain-containing protein n=1 Tax=Clostridium sp. TaxID=1506 RepID=UPI003D6D491F
MPYSIFYVFSVTIALAIIYIIIVKKSLHARFEYDRVVFNVFDRTNIKIVVANSMILPAPYVYVESKILGEFIEGYHGDLFFLGGKGRKWINNEITFTKRGIYNFENISINTNDLFCILRLVKNIRNKHNIIVYPKVYSLCNSDLRRGQDDYGNIVSSKSGIDDFTFIKSIRKYNTGDNLKSVHWKLSAKHGELYVKNFDMVSGEKCKIFINMHRDNLHNDSSGVIEENMVDFSASLAKYMTINRIKTKILIHSKHQKNIKMESEEDFLGFMEYLLKCKSDGTFEFASFIKSSLQHVPSGNSIIIVSIAIDDNLRNLIVNLKETGYKINIFYYGNILNGFRNANFVRNIDILKNMGIVCINFKEIIEKR